MKKLLFAVLLTVYSSFGLAQGQRDILSPSLERNNELKLNVFYLLVGAGPEITYERIFSTHNAIGISSIIPIDKRSFENFEYNASIYYRRYLGARKASGFFFEGNTLFFTEDHDGQKNDYYIDHDGNSRPRYETGLNFYGIGAAFGAKFLTRKGFTGEFHLGTTLPVKKFKSEFLDFWPRIGLTLGKRF